MKKVIERGNIYYYNDDGQFHRLDGPAIYFNNEHKAWYQNGKKHRDDGPAVECSDGTKHWYINGKRHRADGPAIEYPSGNKEWYVSGKHFGSSKDGYTQEQFEKDFKDKGIISNMKLAQQTEDQPWDRKKTDKDGNVCYYNESGQLHRIDGPAVVDCKGNKLWYQNDLLHRTDGPAIEASNGTKRWFQDGKLHRLDGPSVEEPSGTKRWFQNGQLHREDGPAVENANGDKKWYQNGKLHRLDGPAIEKVNGDKAWFQNGERHRLDGPSIEEENGSKEWYIEGKLIGRSISGFTQEQFEKGYIQEIITERSETFLVKETTAATCLEIFVVCPHCNVIQNRASELVEHLAAGSLSTDECEAELLCIYKECNKRFIVTSIRY